MFDLFVGGGDFPVARYFEPRRRARAAPANEGTVNKFHVETLLTYKLGFNQNYYTST